MVSALAGLFCDNGEPVGDCLSIRGGGISVLGIVVCFNGVCLSKAVL